MSNHVLVEVYSCWSKSVLPGISDRSSGSEGVSVMAPLLVVGSPKVSGTKLNVQRPHELNFVAQERE